MSTVATRTLTPAEKYNKLRENGVAGRSASHLLGFLKSSAVKVGLKDKSYQDIMALEFNEFQGYLQGASVYMGKGLKTFAECKAKHEEACATAKKKLDDAIIAAAANPQEKVKLEKEGKNLEAKKGSLNIFHALYNQSLTKFLERASNRNRIEAALTKLGLPSLKKTVVGDKDVWSMPDVLIGHTAYKQYNQFKFDMERSFAKQVQRDYRAATNTAEAYSKSVELSKTNSRGRLAYIIGGLICDFVLPRIFDEYGIEYDHDAANPKPGNSNYIPIS